MYKIVEYNEDYDKKIKDLIISIFIEEFDFEEHHRKYIENENILEEFVVSGGNFWIAIDRFDNVIGTIAAKNLQTGNSLEVKRVYVKNECRGMGIAQKMLDTLEGFAIKKGYEALSLGTYDKLERAIGFYYKNNFSDDETREKEEGVRYMIKNLRPTNTF